MELAEGIHRIGFQRWYERQLMEAHLHLVTAFLCLIMVTACLEGFSLRAGGVEPFVRLFGMFAGGYAGIWALARYGALLKFAERAVKQSVCEKCTAYGALELGGAGTRRGEKPAEERKSGLPPLDVRCRKCGHEWTME